MRICGWKMSLESLSAYAAAAGFREVVPREEGVDLDPVDVLETREARELLAGARFALTEIRRVIATK